jgi:predicted site-specific integrase-resolvase
VRTSHPIQNPGTGKSGGTGGNVKAVAYARFSSDNQREESITAQLRAIRKYADEHDIKIIHTYKDRIITATSDELPDFLRMIDNMRSRQKHSRELAQVKKEIATTQEEINNMVSAIAKGLYNPSIKLT